MDKELKKKKQDLIIKNKNNIMRKYLTNYFPVTMESFICSNEVTSLLNEVYGKVDSLNNARELEKDFELNINELEALSNVFESLYDEEGIYFYSKSLPKLEGIKIIVRDFFSNLKLLAEISKFDTGGGDMIFVSESLEYGICLERFEYVNKLTYWL